MISLDKVSFAYGPGRPVLKHCSLSLRRGDRVGLIGPNGSGKTTLLALMVGLVRPTEGRIEAFGKPCAEEADFHEVRRRVGLLFQDADDQLFCPTVAEDVAFGPLNLGKPREEVRRIVADTLRRLHLEDYEDRVTHKLSGGEKRLVALATVLAMEPDVLLLDEPVAGLDEAATERVIEVLAELPQAMLIVAHDRSFLKRTTLRTLLLSSGGIEPMELDPVAEMEL